MQHVQCVVYRHSKNYVEWKPVNTTTVGPKKIGRINGVVVLTGVDQIRNKCSLNDVMANGVRFELA